MYFNLNCKCDKKCYISFNTSVGRNRNNYVYHNKNPKKAGIFIYTKNTVLLVQSNGRRWGPPKGTLEQGESYEDCALRELKEESGIELGKNQLGKPVMFSRIKACYYFVYLNHVYIDTTNIFSRQCNDATGIALVSHDCLIRNNFILNIHFKLVYYYFKLSIENSIIPTIYKQFNANEMLYLDEIREELKWKLVTVEFLRHLSTISKSIPSQSGTSSNLIEKRPVMLPIDKPVDTTVNSETDKQNRKDKNTIPDKPVFKIDTIKPPVKLRDLGELWNPPKQYDYNGISKNTTSSENSKASSVNRDTKEIPIEPILFSFDDNYKKVFNYIYESITYADAMKPKPSRLQTIVNKTSSVSINTIPVKTVTPGRGFVNTGSDIKECTSTNKTIVPNNDFDDIELSDMSDDYEFNDLEKSVDIGILYKY